MRKLMRATLAVLALLLAADQAGAQLPRSKNGPRSFPQLREYLKSGAYTNTRIVDRGGKGDFTNVKAALDYITTQTPSEASRWLVIVYGGTHDGDPAWTLPDYVTVVFEGSADENADASALTTVASNADYSFHARGGRGAAISGETEALRAWGVLGSSDGATSDGGGGVKGTGFGGTGVWAQSSTGRALMATSTQGGNVATLDQTGPSSQDVVLIQRTAQTGNLTGNLVVIGDNPATAGTVSGDLVKMHSGGGGLGADAERFAVARDGTIRLNGGCLRITGTGAPEGAVTAPVCSLYLRLDGGANTTLCAKTSGTGDTRWTCK